MDFTPRNNKLEVSEDSGCATGSFNISKHLFESTPNVESHLTPKPSLKRKFNRKLTDIIETCSTPQFSSTLNDSLVNNLEKCSITANFYLEREGEESYHVSKYIRTSFGKSKARSAPATPVKQIRDEAMCLDKSQSVSSSFRPAAVNESPYKEAIEILYPNKPVVEPRKCLTPHKFGTNKRQSLGTEKRILDVPKFSVDPIRLFTGKSLILEKIFSYLSNGDLYRVSLVSKTWRESLYEVPKVKERYLDFLEKHRTNKENYTYTPPDSPESPDSPPVSPGRRNFQKYTKLAKSLRPGQSLKKCPICENPAVIDKNIGQCQRLSCSYIYCLECGSSSTTGPEDFHDRCQKAQLVVSHQNRSTNSSRSFLTDCSNSFFEHAGLTSSPIFSSKERINDTSGFVSETESPIYKVKRNLSLGEKGSVLSERNRNVQVVVKTKRRSSLVPVVSSDPKPMEIEETPSPTRVKTIVCSKQSKKNLKRLLF